MNFGGYDESAVSNPAAGSPKQSRSQRVCQRGFTQHGSKSGDHCCACPIDFSGRWSCARLRSKCTNNEMLPSHEGRIFQEVSQIYRNVTLFLFHLEDAVYVYTSIHKCADAVVTIPPSLGLTCVIQCSPHIFLHPRIKLGGPQPFQIMTTTYPHIGPVFFTLPCRRDVVSIGR